MAGSLAALAWAVWWFIGLSALNLPFTDRTWIQYPAFGADFWSQSDYAARLWHGGVDPYENERHLFHYPPVVIRLFLWTPYFEIGTATRIWVVVLMLLVTAGVWRAARTRARVGAREVPFVFLWAAVFWTLPIVFTFERSNFDLITLAAILVAVPLMDRERPAPEFLAGVFLAFGPWVKIYPGLLGVGLVALRRWRTLAGFLTGGVVIGALTPTETLRSFQILHIAVTRVKNAAHGKPFAPWSHSLSIVWIRFGDLFAATRTGEWLAKVPGTVVAGALLFVPLVWVCLAVYRARDPRALTYPVLLFCVCIASFVPEIANDYSLAFFPLAAASVLDEKSPLGVRVAIAASVVAYQPFWIPGVPGWPLLILKLVAVLALGVDLRRRAGPPVRSLALRARAPEASALPAAGA